jgi:glycerophosphoryl diester phosphodiesterase
MGVASPILFAHRGGMARARGNTLEAFALALADGADGLESDVWLTRDGVPVLDHDGRLGRGWRRRPIADCLRAELPAHIPALDDLYRCCGSEFELALDVGEGHSLPAILAVARAHGGDARLWLCSGSRSQIAAWHGRHAGVRLVCSRDRWRPTPGELHAELGLLAQAGAQAVNLRAGRWTPALVDACASRGLAALAWGVRSESEARRVISLGIDGLMGDDVRMLRRAVSATSSSAATPREA